MLLFPYLIHQPNIYIFYPSSTNPFTVLAYGPIFSEPSPIVCQITFPQYGDHGPMCDTFSGKFSAPLTSMQQQFCFVLKDTVMLLVVDNKYFALIGWKWSVLVKGWLT